tara:strand:- start:13367 stop:14629 length:1263 start_codon:yes stop_codon:yes gene_type:complete
MQTNEFEYDAKVGQIYKIWIVNVLLSIITLGIYRFWGKTRVRRYLTSCFSLNKDRFEYTGYGGELFWGFVKALILMLIVSIPFFWSAYKVQVFTAEAEATLNQSQKQTPDEIPSIDQNPKPLAEQVPSVDNATSLTDIANQVSGEMNESAEMPDDVKVFFSVYFIYLFFFFAFLPFVAKFQALRYRAARLQWRGIRAHLNGSALWYGFMGFLHVGLMVFTAFLWKPFADLLLLRYKMKRIQFGDQTGQLNGLPYFNLFLVYLGLGFLFIMSLIVMGVIGYFSLGGISPEQLAQMQNQPIVVVIAFVIYVGFLLYAFFIHCIYKAAINRALYNHLTLGDIRFQTSMTGKQLFGFYFVNLLILICTLGLGYPFIMHRKQKFFQRHVKVIGDLENTNISQASGKKYKTGEGLFAFLDLRISLF